MIISRKRFQEELEKARKEATDKVLQEVSRERGIEDRDRWLSDRMDAICRRIDCLEERERQSRRGLFRRNQQPPDMAVCRRY